MNWGVTRSFGGLMRVFRGLVIIIMVATIPLQLLLSSMLPPPLVPERLLHDPRAAHRTGEQRHERGPQLGRLLGVVQKLQRAATVSVKWKRYDGSNTRVGDLRGVKPSSDRMCTCASHIDSNPLPPHPPSSLANAAHHPPFLRINVPDRSPGPSQRRTAATRARRGCSKGTRRRGTSCPSWEHC